MVIELDETRDHVTSLDCGAQLHGGAGERRLVGQAPVVAGTLDAGSRRKEAQKSRKSNFELEEEERKPQRRDSRGECVITGVRRMFGLVLSTGTACIPGEGPIGSVDLGRLSLPPRPRAGPVQMHNNLRNCALIVYRDGVTSFVSVE